MLKPEDSAQSPRRAELRDAANASELHEELPHKPRSARAQEEHHKEPAHLLQGTFEEERPEAQVPGQAGV